MGSDRRIRAHHDESKDYPVSVAVENPAHPGEPLRRLTLRDGALATSGTYRAKHLLSPATGRPITHGTAIVAVVLPTCAEADAWATALIVAGGENALRLAKQRHIKVLTVSARGERRGTLASEVSAP